jgi:hypothetical protein
MILSGARCGRFGAEIRSIVRCLAKDFVGLIDETTLECGIRHALRIVRELIGMPFPDQQFVASLDFRRTCCRRHAKDGASVSNIQVAQRRTRATMAAATEHTAALRPNSTRQFNASRPATSQ